MGSYIKLTKPTGRTIIMGDIHGCYDEMLHLLKNIGFSRDDILICVGDIMDRGPKSWEVALYFKETTNAYCVLGNHERRIAGIVGGTSSSEWTQLQSLSKISQKAQIEWKEHFESLPAVIETDEAIITHARLDPDKGITEQDPRHTCAVGGKGVKIELDDQGVPLWYHQWVKVKGSKKPIFMGHLSYSRVELVPNGLYALDTGAVGAGKLTVYILPERKIVGIDVGKNYHAESLTEWKKTTLLGQPVETMKMSVIQEILSKPLKDDVEEQLIFLFQKALGEKNIEDRLSKVHETIELQYGKMPDEDKARGEYHQRIKKELHHLADSKTISLLITGNISQKDILQCFGEMTLEDVSSVASRFEKQAEREAFVP